MKKVSQDTAESIVKALKDAAIPCEGICRHPKWPKTHYHLLEADVLSLVLRARRFLRQKSRKVAEPKIEESKGYVCYNCLNGACRLGHSTKPCVCENHKKRKK